MGTGEFTGLVTGFEPFGGHAVNPSARLLPRLDGLVVGGVTVRTALLPVSLARGPATLVDLVGDNPLVFLLMMGLASGAAAVRVEMLAVNVAAIRVADNDGRFASGEPLEVHGPAARHATWDGPEVVAAIEAVGVPARQSFHAGTHLCNAVLYAALGHVERRHPRPACGFLHLPFLPEQALMGADGGSETPSMDGELQFRAAEAAIATMVRSRSVLSA